VIASAQFVLVVPRKKRERESMSDSNDYTSTSDDVPMSPTRTTKPRSYPVIPEDEESAEIDDSSATAVKKGGLRANSLKKLETMLKNREKNRKEKQRTKDGMDELNKVMVETHIKKHDPELMVQKVKELFEDRVKETDSWREDYDAACASIALQLSQQGGNGL
jgi:hypothetical protein